MTSSMKVPELKLMPRMCLTWPKAIVIAEAVVKPATTEAEMNPVKLPAERMRRKNKSPRGHDAHPNIAVNTLHAISQLVH